MTFFRKIGIFGVRVVNDNFWENWNFWGSGWLRTIFRQIGIFGFGVLVKAKLCPCEERSGLKSCPCEKLGG